MKATVSRKQRIGFWSKRDKDHDITWSEVRKSPSSFALVGSYPTNTNSNPPHQIFSWFLIIFSSLYISFSWFHQIQIFSIKTKPFFVYFLKKWFYILILICCFDFGDADKKVKKHSLWLRGWNFFLVSLLSLLLIFLRFWEKFQFFCLFFIFKNSSFAIET